MRPALAPVARLALVLLAALFLVHVQVDPAPAGDSESAGGGPRPKVVMSTSMGDITLELFRTEAPETVANFLRYADTGFYTGTIFHRVIETFMIQGGGMNAKMEEKRTRSPIRNEAANGLSNRRGTIAMARTSDPDSATAQFFINVTDNTFLDYRDATVRGYGYCVFGRVVKGMDVVDRIKGVATRTVGYHQNVPGEAVTITGVKRAE